MNEYQKALETLCEAITQRKNLIIRLAIGNLNELVEKATPKKPIGDLHSVPHYRCPICHGGVKMYEDSIVYPFCHHCGQALDWSKEDE